MRQVDFATYQDEGHTREMGDGLCHVVLAGRVLLAGQRVGTPRSLMKLVSYRILCRRQRRMHSRKDTLEMGGVVTCLNCLSAKGHGWPYG